MSLGDKPVHQQLTTGFSDSPMDDRPIFYQQQPTSCAAIIVIINWLYIYIFIHDSDTYLDYHRFHRVVLGFLVVFPVVVPFSPWFSHGFSHGELTMRPGYSPTVVEDFDRSELASKCGGSTSVPKARICERFMGKNPWLLWR